MLIYWVAAYLLFGGGLVSRAAQGKSLNLPIWAYMIVIAFWPVCVLIGLAQRD